MDNMHELAQSLAAAQAEMKNPVFDRVNPAFRSRYASLAAVRDAVIGPLSRQGIAVIQTLAATDAGIACTTVLIHKSGQSASSVFELPVAKRDPQGMLSAATYAKRASLQAMCVVVGDDDDDGNAAQQAQAQDAAPPPRPKATPDLVDRFNACLTMDEVSALWKSLSPAQRASALDLKDAAKQRVGETHA